MRQGHKADERADLAPVPELAPGEMLGYEDPRRVLADPAQGHELPDLRGHRIGWALHGLVAFGLESLEVRRDQLHLCPLAREALDDGRRQRLAIPPAYPW